MIVSATNRSTALENKLQSVMPTGKKMPRIWSGAAGKKLNLPQ